MVTSMEFLWGAAGFILGGLAVWLWAGVRVRVAEGLLAETKQRLVEAEEDLRLTREQLDVERTARTRAETLLAESQKKIEEERKFLDEAAQKLADSFRSLAGEALRQNNQVFLDLARQNVEAIMARARGDLGQGRQAVESLVVSLRQALEQYEREIKEMEKARREAYGSLTRHLEELSQAQQLLQSEARKLVSALRTPRTRGRWGEITLQRVVEMVGMSPYCDFTSQFSVDSEDGRVRPDMVVHLPNGRLIIIDAKTPLEAYLDAVEVEEEEAKNKALQRHARAVRNHMQMLGSKDYQSRFKLSLDFVVMFLPGEPYFGAAVEQDPALIEDAFNRRVLLATPVTLVALLKAVAYSWQQKQASENAEQVIEAGRQLFERVCVFAEHLAGMRRGLISAVESFNQVVGSWQTRLLPAARRFQELGVTKNQRELKEIEDIETLPREVQPN
ncbi:MAG TPA: DNA recombination protein RmuC [Syntrophothermus lipocalidus]|nr:DNA recombination protein RmuC [Syntrophothermus lipocalidus]